MNIQRLIAIARKEFIHVMRDFRMRILIFGQIMVTPIRKIEFILGKTIEILRAIVIKGVGVKVLWPAILAQAALAVSFIALAWALFTKTLD